MIPEPLSRPAGAYAKFCSPVESSNSVQAAIRRMKDHDLPAIPVMVGGVFGGVIDERSAFMALASAETLDQPCDRFLVTNPETILASESGSAALRVFEKTGAPYLVVLDRSGIPRGILQPSGLVSPGEFENRPSTVGGMATPFGVYLTNGSIGAGVSPWALVATGAVMFLLMVIGVAAVNLVGVAVPRNIGNNPAFHWALRLAAIVIFRTGMWAAGISGLHASEHQVVNAIEQDEPLEFDVVRRMSRVHPRCGTNLVVGLTLFLSMLSLAWPKEMEERVLLSILVTFIFYRPLGTLAQLYVTTTPARPKQTLKGIAAGRDLLTKFEQNPMVVTNPVIRLFNSGLLHVMVGASLMGGFLTLMAMVLNLPPSWRTIIGF